MLDERKMQVLRAIVTDYVASREPVGSKALVERHQLGVSPATVRNDMAVRRATSPRPTPAQGAFPPTRATGSSSTSSPR